MPLRFRTATPAEDAVIAEHFYQMWRDLSVPAEQIQPDWQQRVMDFIAMARQSLGFQAFVAQAPTGELIGSTSCQRFAGLYPLILLPTYQQRGYIWGVFVEAAYRRQGIATKLTTMAVDHLKTLGCTHALLNASPLGQPVYANLGFEPGNLMSLK
ncbi:MAG: GNAT family N-acetyltransferase, partial [Cyanobacteria bacterium P01_D01_bin.44]